MSKLAVVYWSGTGNTEMMAQAVAAGAADAGAEVTILTAADFGPEQIETYDAIAFGCPSMGAEELEDFEFEPMFSVCTPGLNGKKIGLFGSYGWGGGEWMNNWKATCLSAGAILAAEPVICCGAPDNDASVVCRALGATLA